MKDEIVQWLESLWCQIILVLHLIDFEIDETCIGEDNESCLPVTEETLGFLGKGTNLADANEEIAHHFVCKSWITLDDLLLQALVAHEKLLVIYATRSLESIIEGIVLCGVLIVDCFLLHNLLECLKSSNIMINTSTLLGLCSVLLSIFLFFESSLDLHFD